MYSKLQQLKQHVTRAGTERATHSIVKCMWKCERAWKGIDHLFKKLRQQQNPNNHSQPLLHT